jgi:hypothetical protein
MDLSGEEIRLVVHGLKQSDGVVDGSDDNPGTQGFRCLRSIRGAVITLAPVTVDKELTRRLVTVPATATQREHFPGTHA